MSSIYHRISRVNRRIARCIYCSMRVLVAILRSEPRHPAVNNRRCMDGGLGSWVGGETGERHDTDSGVDRGGVVASQSGRGVRAVVHRRVGFLSGLRQGAGEVRDAASSSGRGCSGGRSSGGTWLFTGSVLSGGGRVRPVGDGGVARRAARSPWPGQAAPGDRGLHPRRRRLGGPDRRAGGRPVRGAVAPAHRRAGAPAVSARSFWPPAEAAQVDYETLRGHVLELTGLPEGLAAARFARRGLGGLIAWPSAEPVFVAELLAAVRPAWTPHDDPRVAALAASYQFLLDAAARVDSVAALALPGRGLRCGRRCMRGCRPRRRPTAAPSARSWRCCARASPLPVTSWSASTSMTGIPGPGWTDPAWTRCVMPPRRDSSNGCGACRRTGSPAPTPTRCWCSTSWTASASPSHSQIPRGWPPMTRSRCC